MTPGVPDIRWFTLLALLVVRAASGAMIVGGGGDRGGGTAPLWFTSEMVGGARVNLILPGAEPGTFVFGTDVQRLPVAISAGGVRTIMIFETPEAARPVRQTHMGFGPGDRLIGVDLAALPSLPGDGTLAGVVSTEQGDFALLIGMQFPLADETRESFAQGPALLLLKGSGWSRVALPDGIDPAHEWRLIAIGGTPAIIEHRAPDRARVWMRDETGHWTPQVWSIPRDARGVLGVEGGLIVERYEDDSAIFAFVRGESVLARGRVDGCPQDHDFALLGDDLVVLGVDRSGSDAKLFSAWVARDGTVRHAGELRPISPISRRDVETLIVLIASAALTTILFLLRIAHETQSVIRIPAGSSIAPTWKRVSAALMDLAPALMCVLLFWPEPESGSTMTDLTMAYGPWPPLTVGAIMFVHCTIGEWLFGRSLGKAIAGCWTVSIKTGRKPTFLQCLGRNFVKVACPPLGMVQAMAPGRPEPWGFSTTVVVRRAGSGEGSTGAGGSGGDIEGRKRKSD